MIRNSCLAPAVLLLIEKFSQQLASSLDYSHLPIAEQLDALGMRQLELDVFADPQGGPIQSFVPQRSKLENSSLDGSTFPSGAFRATYQLTAAVFSEHSAIKSALRIKQCSPAVATSRSPRASSRVKLSQNRGNASNAKIFTKHDPSKSERKAVVDALSFYRTGMFERYNSSVLHQISLLATAFFGYPRKHRNN